MKIYSIKIKNFEEVSYNMGSSLHGYIFDNISDVITEEIHQSKQIFVQHIYRNERYAYWRVVLFDMQYVSEFDDLLLNLKYIELKNPLIILEINNIEIKSVDNDDIVRCGISYFKNGRAYLQTITPNSHKANGEYLIFPDIHHILSNIIKSFNSVMTGYEITDKDVIQDIINNTKITSYRLKSTPYYLKQSRVQGYMGEYLISSRTKYVEIFSLLMYFALYSGIGIKRRLGMGAIILKEEG